MIYDKDLIDPSKLDGVSSVCADPKRFLWLRLRLRRVDWFFDKTLWFRLAGVLHRYTEAPHFNGFLMGVYRFAWIKFCGYGWRFAVRIGLIHWGFVKVAESPPPRKQ